MEMDVIIDDVFVSHRLLPYRFHVRRQYLSIGWTRLGEAVMAGSLARAVGERRRVV